ncbi:hypothetical protein CC78DRAFT_524041 [Lojkania enalia]|uniref:Anaphase-promoting complex subunit 1 n=1 Tax=Lojkania enalia TaxID=147567 RepID=A0A9P4N2Q3_9PLEO|nr:hypothetical protein CC78DRAFT_524041 [Didymosphaeria enalia]
MATLRSLGVHKPAALQYLIDESVLSDESTKLDYTWDSYSEIDSQGPTDELVTTEYHVVWARGGVVRKVFNFEIEQEKVIQALLTWFPTEESSSPTTSSASEVAEYVGHDLSKIFLTQGTQPATDPNGTIPQAPRIIEGRARALVVFLKSQAHVFFLTGATHVINLPFEVEKAFPAARGVLLQRKILTPNLISPSPRPPPAPPNSFLTNNQSSPLSSSTTAKAGNALFLDELLKNPGLPTTDGLPRLFSFTDPLSELGLVVNVVTGNERASFLTTNGSGHRRLEPINKAEEVIYVSPQNELRFDESGNDKPMLLAITANNETNVLTIWSAAYLEPKSISASRKHHASQLGNKVRRRSSYGPTAPGTGATTPALRGSDRLRESFGGAIRGKSQPPSFSISSQSKDRLSDQAVEDALASQLNPEFDMSRQPKESRRVSSLLSRAELSTSFDKSAFQDLATQRTSLGGSFNASFGASQRSRHSLGNDRTSFGGLTRRHRASTPGSVTSRMSLGGLSMDDTLENIMDEDTFDTIEDYDELDDLFSPHDPGFDQEPINGLRKELSVKVFVVTAPFNSAMLHQRGLYVYVNHSALANPLEIEFAVTRKRLSVAATQSRLSTNAPRYACIPKFVKVDELRDSVDILKIRDGHVERVVGLNPPDSREASISLMAGWGTHLPTKFTIRSLKLFNPYAIVRDGQMRVTAGLKRTITLREPVLRIVSSGSRGTFDVIDAESRRHQIQVDMSPRDPFVSQLFRILSTILPNHAGDFLLEIWWSIRKSFSNASQLQANSDWIAFITTLFSLAIALIDDKTVNTEREKHPQKRGGGRNPLRTRPAEAMDDEISAWHLMCSRQGARLHAKSWESAPWAWVQKSRPSPVIMSPPSSRVSAQQSSVIALQIKRKSNLLVYCAERARQFVQTPIGKAANDHWRRMSPSEKQDLRISCLSEILVTLHLFREEQKLDILSIDSTSIGPYNLAPVLAQLGHWLRWESWGWGRKDFYNLDGGSSEDWQYENSYFMSNVGLHEQPWPAPPSILEWIGVIQRFQYYVPFPTLAMLIRKSKASPHSSINIDEVISRVTPRTVALSKYFQDIDQLSRPARAVELVERCGITSRMLATLPEAAKAPLMEAITRCQANPPTTWSGSLLKLVKREDLDLSLLPTSELLHDVQQNQSNSMVGMQSTLLSSSSSRDIHTICQGVEKLEGTQSVAEAERHHVTRLIFHEDRRFMEAYYLLEPLKQSVAEYRPDSRLEESAILDGQKILMQWVMVRTFSLPVGSSMIKFSSKKPLLTEKYPLYGFATSCLMKPMGNVVTAERANYSEEKYFWAFFNAGVAAGLSISRDAKGIDTSWIMYNKPAELTNKHAGLLLGLGLNGHLKTIAKWLSFKYLTPKHTMTSVGLLLGLSASYMGTMDTLVTRLLSVHVTRMLPPGAAELNISPYTQTTGLMGIGLLYYNTQHRRMSEVMLSEIEHVDEPDPAEPLDTLRDEAYRLAAGFALGFINLGKGKDLQGLHDMRIVERLMAVAVAPKPVDIVHILDQATAGAVIAISLIFMKTHNEAVARKIDVPDTLPQFDYVRPDIFLLRTLAKHLIMWDNIRADNRWIMQNLPPEYRDDYNLKNITKLRSDQMPFFNILAGLLWSVSLRYAGTGDIQVRNFLIKYLDQFMRINRLQAIRYDSKLARNAVRNCQDLVALAAATVMAGTGDLEVFRRLRGLHGRIGPEAPYGSHLACHMAFGTLFIAGGTHTFSTSNKAIASLICAFYPLYPMDVQDSRAHLQAFRHFWVLAAEPRCLIVRDVDTGRAISMVITVRLRNNMVKTMVAPCLLPELHIIESIETGEVSYWPTTLDFVNNPLHLQSFKLNQTLHVRRRTAHDMFASTFSATLIALNDAQMSRTTRLMWDWLFSLPSLQEFEQADIGLILPVDPYSSTHLDPSATVVDHRLVLGALSRSWKANDLWELKGVFEWAESTTYKDGKLRWLGREVVERLKARILERGRGIEGVQNPL